MSIHWPSYCTVSVIIVFHFCDRVLLLWVEANMWRSYYYYYYYYYQLLISILPSKEGLEPIGRFNPPHFLLVPFMFNYFEWWVIIRLVDIGIIIETFWTISFYRIRSEGLIDVGDLCHRLDFIAPELKFYPWFISYKPD
jgi:hypothetical protein